MSMNSKMGSNSYKCKQT